LCDRQQRHAAQFISRPAIVPAHFYVDSLVHDADALRLLVKLFGAQRIALGSDHPFPLGESHAGALIKSMTGLADNEKTQLLFATAREFLGFP
jgi:aminocarboxymuconate-semialdehyde decarboxylase